MTLPIFYVNQQVETRRGKIGTVVSIDESARTVDVRFGSKVFTMRYGQIVDARRAQKVRSYRTPNYGARG